MYRAVTDFCPHNFKHGRELDALRFAWNPFVFVLAAAYIVHVDLVLFNVHVLDHSLSVATASLRFWFCAPGFILAHFQQRDYREDEIQY